MGIVTLTHDCDIERRGDVSAPADLGGDFRDTYIQSIDANGIYEGTQFNAGILGTGGDGKMGIYHIRSLLWFDLNYFLPADAVIINAVWHYYVFQASGSDTHSYDINRITQTGWVEGQVTWNDYATGLPWTTAGGDYTTTDPYSIFLGNMNSTGWQTTNILSMVIDAWYGRSGICTFILRRTDSDGDDGEVLIHAKNYRPFGVDKPHHLRITYTLDGKTFQKRHVF